MLILPLLWGCAHHSQVQYAPLSGEGASQNAVARPSLPPPVPAAGEPPAKAIVTPETTLYGAVASVNKEAGFVVLNFPVGHMPAVGQQMNLYRRGMRVGEVKITGPQLDDDIDADVLTGDAAAGDEVRDK